MRFGPLLICIALVLGCSSGSAPYNGPVKGTIGGEPFTTSGTVAIRFATDTCTNPESIGPMLARVIIFYRDLDTAYVLGHTCSTKASSVEVGVALWQFNPSGDIAPGTYPFASDANSGQVAWWNGWDAECKATSNMMQTGGSVTIETNDATHIVGRLDASFDGGDQLSGRFDATVVEWTYNVCEWFGFPGGTPGPGCPTQPCVP
jgi:hypothetical protein